jgi:hypothetical protein
MASLAKSPLEVVAGGKRENLYHSDAFVLSADLEQPLRRKIRPIAGLELCESGDGDYYEYKHAEHFRLDGILSFESGYTQIGSHKCAEHGNATLTTAAIANINVLDVVTADRVVAQIFTEYSANSRVPSVSFLGTRFENLRIGGKKIDVGLNLGVLGAKPADDQPYMQDSGSWQTENQVQTTLVQSVTGIQSVGKVIDLPPFGKIYLAELILKRKPDPDDPGEFVYSITLEMMRLELGCQVKGRVRILMADPNGKGGKGNGT